MRIAQVSPLYESVPPRYYGGTERVVSYLTEELVAQGHDVTLFASGDSETSARLISPCPRSLRLASDCIDQLAHHIVMLELVAKHAAQFDVIHFHIDYLHFPLSRRLTVPHLTTLHGRLDLPDLAPLYRVFPEMPLASISMAQRQPLYWANWVATVPHGLPPRLYHLREAQGNYLCFVGRVSPEKRVDRAIEIAKRSDMPLKIAAKIDKTDQDYFDALIKPLISHSDIEYIGELGDNEKDELLGNAYALLFPIDWPEPFGLVMIEAMACGTPVIAYRHGSVPEVLDDGMTGCIVESMEEAVRATRAVTTLDRRRCRQVFEERFTATRMARDYVNVYEQLISQLRSAEMADTPVWRAS
jgi:glycosyltransferase involved in cell wall biosynthesis